jgi:hypothetical protein
LEVVESVELLELASIQRGDTGASSLAKGLKLCSFFSLALFHQSQALAKHFASVLVAPGTDQGLNDLLLMLRQHDVPGRHKHSVRSKHRITIKRSKYAIAGSAKSRKLLWGHPEKVGLALVIDHRRVA